MSCFILQSSGIAQNYAVPYFYLGIVAPIDSFWGEATEQKAENSVFPRFPPAEIV